MAFNVDTPSDNPSETPFRNTSGNFPPAKGNRKLTEADVALPENDKGNPVSTGNGGIKTSRRIKNRGTHDTPGVEKTVNYF